MILPYTDTRGVGSKENLYNMIRIFSKITSGLKIYHINAQSLNNKMDEFRFIFEESDIDILCVSESWFYPEIQDTFYDLSGYRLRSSMLVR